jgi:uncharacterized protein YciI
VKKIIITIVLVSAICSGQQEKQYFFVFLNTNPERENLTQEKVMGLQEGHMANINRLAEEGKLITAGPVKGGGGIFILYANSIDEANQFLETDPAIKAKRFILEVYPAIFLQGKLCKVEEADFNMVSYTIIRHGTGIEDNLIGEDSIVLLQLNFAERDDGISILKYDIEKDGRENLEELLKDSYRIEYMKTLWIAEGSFCENN